MGMVAIDSLTVAVLAAACYFKASWAHQLCIDGDMTFETGTSADASVSEVYCMVLEKAGECFECVSQAPSMQCRCHMMALQPPWY
jgi:hypothetical protein